MNWCCARSFRVVAVGLVLACTACSPGLNWREVQLGHIVALLPCKPDKAQRTVQLGQRSLQLELQGCEAQATLFALSHVVVANPADAGAVVAHWRSASVANMRAVVSQEHAFQVKGWSTHPAAVVLEAQGLNPAGGTVHARLAWFIRGAQVYHLAAYGPQASAMMSEPLFADVRVFP